MLDQALVRAECNVHRDDVCHFLVHTPALATAARGRRRRPVVRRMAKQLYRIVSHRTAGRQLQATVTPEPGTASGRHASFSPPEDTHGIPVVFAPAASSQSATRS